MRELALVGGTYGVYTLTRNTLPTHVAIARSNALDLYQVEQQLHVDVERATNDLFATQMPHWLGVVANYAYSVPHLAVTVAVLAWLYAARPSVYRRARSVLVTATLLALLGFWLFPLAPPRFFPNLGFVDTVVHDRTWGSWGDGTMNEISNQYAAMPSLHVSWSVWVAAVVILCSHHWWVRALAAGYPLLVTVVVLGTANHWIFDAVAGVAAVALAVALCAMLSGLRRRWREHASAQPAGHRRGRARSHRRRDDRLAAHRPREARRSSSEREKVG